MQTAFRVEPTSSQLRPKNTVHHSPQRTKTHQKRRVHLNPLGIVINILAVTVILSLIFTLFANSINNNAPEKQNFNYTTTECVVTGGNLIVFSGKPNVRSEPLAATHEYTVYAGTAAGAAGYGIESKSVNTSYGKLKDSDDDGAVFSVDRVLKCNLDSWNGPFYGIYLSDLSETGRKLLPKSVAKDPDGIVWISGKYLFTDNIEMAK